ncbi:hypothetical protein SLS64_004872 [Diaporthe eres]|uniref:Uncharacterized protein n=1 Tax=Diaporthe eres TaxID=83184 RepID=A0ABR1NRZ8_DIAER
METDRSNFWQLLPTILKAISEAQYVAVDLEMSGIFVDNFRDTAAPVKPTLQEAYADARMAAEQFTILQFGFTCISLEPRKKKSYVTKTFNIPLHPGVEVGNVATKEFAAIMDRCFRLSTNTLHFLESNGFNLSSIFQRGVPYLSASEFNRKATLDFIDGKRQTENLIDVGELPTKSTEFRNDVKEKIINWRTQQDLGAQPKPVEVRSSPGHRLNGLQKRLVRELLQDQFPELRAVPQDRGVRMDILDSSRQIPDFRKPERTQAVFKQIGARLLWDAICGQPFAASVDTELVKGENAINDTQLMADLKKFESRLQNRSPVVIGHNILMDLCFLHSNFVAPVPESLQEFRALTRERLPRIVDTKYLFTRGGDEMSPDYSLGESFNSVKKEPFPVVAPDPSCSYGAPRSHEAGYDSYMTAVVFLKKSYQLSQTREGLYYIASEDLGEEEALRSRSNSFSSPKLNQQRMTPDLLKAAPPPPLPPMSDIPKAPSSPGNVTKPRPPGPDNFLEDRDEHDVAALAKFGVMQPEKRPAAPATAPPTPKQSLEGKPTTNPNPTPEHGDKSRVRAVVPGMVPEWEGEFWSKYGNRTRVGDFGHILYIGKMAGEQLPGEAGECKTENLGTQMLEEPGRKPPEEDGEQESGEEVYYSAHSS